MQKLTALWRTLFVGKPHHGWVQFFRYGLVGGVAAFFDIGSLYLLVSGLHVHYLVAVAVAFIIGVTVNYLLSIRWVFTSSDKKKLEFALFVLIGIGGLGLNELLIWALVEFAHAHYIGAKLVAVIVVLIWNFGLRKVL
ncbi:MAG TPA: GtrA family protein, partial [Candidatus Saccharimonadales bacterium]|nr:GtrA family protein [Candidatus Saccharimonadales bacterium]